MIVVCVKPPRPVRRLLAALFGEIFKRGGIEDIDGYYALDGSFYRPGEGVITDLYFNYDKDNFMY